MGCANVHPDPATNDHPHANGGSGEQRSPALLRPTPARRTGVGLLGLLLALVVLACFLPAVRHDFICLDDHGYVTENPHVLGGFTRENLAWAFRSTEQANWHPLTWCSHILDAQLFGARPWGHHLTSVGLHAVNTLLVLLVLCQLTGAYWRSLMVAALFGLHPLRVESVAWVAERKDVLSSFFGLLTLWAYACWAQRIATRRPRAFAFYWLALAFFALGLMSKPMLVTVPCLLLLLDFWPLGRFEGTVASGWRLVREKIPFFALAATACEITYLAQDRVGALATWQTVSRAARVSNALTAYCRYLGKGLFPTGLAVSYPFAPTVPVFWTLLAATLLVGISAAAFLWRRRWPYLVVGWLWFLGMLVPVIGLVQFGRQAMADRYSYLPLIGVLIAVVWGVADSTAGWARQRFVLGLLAGAVLASCAALTWRQLGFWQNSETLFRHALAVTEGDFTSHYCLGYALAHSPGRQAEAIAEYRAAVQLDPNQADVHHALGKLLAETPGRLPEGISEFRTAIRLKPEDADAHLNLGIALANTPGGLPEAISEYREALRLKPESVLAHYHLAQALAQLPERRAEAVAEYRTVLRDRPDWVGVRCDLGVILASMPGRLPEAIAEYQTALRAQPGFVEAHNNLGNALSQTPGRTADAIAEYRVALAIRPDFWEAQFNLGALLADSPEGRAEAIVHLEAALRLKPDLEPARALIARLQTQR